MKRPIPYEEFTYAELLQALGYARENLARMEQSDHPLAGWSAKVVRENIGRMAALFDTLGNGR